MPFREGEGSGRGVVARYAGRSADRRRNRSRGRSEEPQRQPVDFRNRIPRFRNASRCEIARRSDRRFSQVDRIGAPDPRDAKDVPKPAQEKHAEQKPLWSLKPIENPQPPKVQDADWPKTDVDRFIKAELEKRGLESATDAGPQTLLRRVYFDLIGLPPTPAQLAAFEKNPTPEAFANVVDELLASPQFGERWGRHWFDVVRYAESAGNSRDVLMPYAWRYRDYVIDALNADVPYDRFITEQIAGDLLPADSPEDRDRLKIATGLLAVGSKSLNGGNIELDLADDQIDVISKSVLGLTVSCARCHDHKFDPIPTKDYYALVGIFKSTKTYYGGGTNRPKNTTDELKVYLPLGENVEQTVKKVAEHTKAIADANKDQSKLSKQVKALQKKLPKNWKDRLAELAKVEKPKPEDKNFLAQAERMEAAQAELKQVQERVKELKQQKLPELQYTVGVVDENKPADSRIHIRGERSKQGEIAPRGFLSCVSLQNVPQVNDKHSGRLELARWLTQPDHPLTIRVIVNRIWQHLFGRGLVETVDNFGTQGLPPSHPELLDWLAYRFVHVHHYSIKAMIRELVLSRTYRQSSDYQAENYAADPANQWYWRMSRRRLEAEPLRDAMLFAAGHLNLDRPHGSPVLEIGEGEVGRNLNTKPLQKPFPYRSVYLPIIRGIIPEFLKIFDLPEPSNPQGQRDTTNVPAQALFLLNNPFVLAQAEGLAERVVEQAPNDAERLELMYRITLSRNPTAAENSRSLRALQSFKERMTDNKEKQAWTLFAQSLFASAEFRYVE